MELLKPTLTRVLSSRALRKLDELVRVKKNNGGLRIINFHRVISDDVSDYRRVSGNPDSTNFESIISFMSENYEFISLDNYINKRLSLDPKKLYLALTFDDGYLDNYTNALPILRKYSIPVTIFVSIDALDDKALWFQKIYCAINYYHGDIVENPCTNEPVHTGRKWHAMDEIANSFKTCDVKRYNANLEKLISACSLDADSINFNTESMMNWEHIKELRNDDLVSFGSHAKSHLPLVSLSDRALSDELNESYVRLCDALNIKTLYLAYPNSRYDNRVIEAVKNAGYKAAFTMERGWNTANTNLFEINREYISNDTKRISMQLSDYDIRMKSLLGLDN